MMISLALYKNYFNALIMLNKFNLKNITLSHYMYLVLTMHKFFCQKIMLRILGPKQKICWKKYHLLFYSVVMGMSNEWCDFITLCIGPQFEKTVDNKFTCMSTWQGNTAVNILCNISDWPPTQQANFQLISWILFFGLTLINSYIYFI